MSKRLCIDCGNTRVKAAVLDGDEVAEKVTVAYDDLSPLLAMVSRHAIASAMMVSTTDAEEEVARAMAPKLPCALQRLTHDTPVPLAIAYRTPHTLGLDRVATAVGAWAEFTGCNLLVVDAGTAITQDVVLADGTFLGGTISPGVEMRFRAMHDYTSRLPQVDAYGETPVVGYDTLTAMRSGAVLGAAGEIDCKAATLRQLLGGQLKVMLTGGDAELLAEYLQLGNVTIDGDLLFKGLGTIMENDN